MKIPQRLIARLTAGVTAALFALVLLALPARAHADLIVKLATLAPEGSAWMRLFREWQKAVETRTAGRVKFKFYAGGVQGDERDVLRKVRLGQLSGGAVTGIGLQSINPDVRALEVARDYGELDYLRAALGAELKQKFTDRGYVLLGWGDVGPVQIFSNRPLKSLDDLRATKLWQWSDDPVSAKLFAALNIRGVPLGVPDVLPALSTGAIDAFFGSPLSTLALQWSTHAKYVSSMIFGQATGASIVAQKVWDQIAPADQAIILEEAAKLQTQLVVEVRRANAQALEGMVKQGLTVVQAPVTLSKELEAKAEQVAMAAGAEIDAKFRDKVKALVEEYRKKH